MSRASPGASGLRDDIRRLNSALAPHLTLLTVRVPAVPGRPRARRADVGETCVLVERLPGGERRAAAPLPRSSTRRARLLAISAALADCAMSLGLGTSVCRPSDAPR